MCPSGMHISGIVQPMGSMGPGQLIIPSPQFLGKVPGQGAGKARAVERRAKSRRDISMLGLLDNSAFSSPPDPNLYPKATCELFASLNAMHCNLCPLFQLPLVLLQVLLFSYYLILVALLASANQEQPDKSAASSMTRVLTNRKSVIIL